MRVPVLAVLTCAVGIGCIEEGGPSADGAVAARPNGDASLDAGAFGDAGIGPDGRVESDARVSRDASGSPACSEAGGMCACVDPLASCVVRDGETECVRQDVLCGTTVACPAGYRCDGTRTCVCNDRETCGRSCAGGRPCACDEICRPQSNLCAPRPPCVFNDHCPEGSLCDDGTCRPRGPLAPGSRCSENAECSSVTCENDECLADCWVNADCESGLTCVDGYCRLASPCPFACEPSEACLAYWNTGSVFEHYCLTPCRSLADCDNDPDRPCYAHREALRPMRLCDPVILSVFATDDGFYWLTNTDPKGRCAPAEFYVVLGPWSAPYGSTRCSDGSPCLVDDDCDVNYQCNPEVGLCLRETGYCEVGLGCAHDYSCTNDEISACPDGPLSANHTCTFASYRPDGHYCSSTSGRCDGMGACCYSIDNVCYE